MNPSLENDISCLLESMQYLGNDENQMIQALEHLAEMTLQGMITVLLLLLLCQNICLKI